MKNSNFFFIIFFLIFFNLKNFNNSNAEIPIYEIEGQKLIYKNDNSTIVAEGNASAKDQFGRKIFSKKIIYNKKESIITTENQSVFEDNNKNKLIAESFNYNINSKILNAKTNVKFSDKNGNLFNFSELKYYYQEENGVGINFVGKLSDKSTVEGSIAEFNNKLKILTVGKNENENFLNRIINIFKKKQNNYTYCKNKNNNFKNIEEQCPDWSIHSSKNIHDKNKKMIYHYDTVIKIKNIPVFYTPYFSHPDPSVKRKSGFLFPSFQNLTDVGQSITIPYFWEINNSKDLTFTPIYYFNENPIFLTEYRQQNANSKFYIDTSYTKGYKNLNKLDSNGNLIQRTSGSKNHFFFNFLGNYNDLLFASNDLEYNIQRISQKNYLSIHEINTNYIKKDIQSLNNNIILNSYENNKRLTLRANIYENLNIENRNTKYQYTIPSIDFSNFFKKSDYNLNLTNSFSAINQGGDSNQIYLNNKIDINKELKQLVQFDGLVNTFKGSINQINFNNQNIPNEKENFNTDIFFTFALESLYPLIKIKDNQEQTIIPKIFSKITTGTMTDAGNEKKILNYDDIFSMNRTNNITNPETGVSMGYGIEYSNTYKNDKNEIYQKTEISIGQVAKPEKISQMPKTSTLQDTRSAFVGNISVLKNNLFNIENNNFDLRYDYLISKNLDKILKNSINTNIKIKNNLISGLYYEAHEISNEHYAEIKYTKKIDNEISFFLGERKNIRDNYTENNFIGLNYENDCIKIGLNLSKTFYQNEEIRPAKNFSLILTLKPLGSISPNLSQLIN